MKVCFFGPAVATAVSGGLSTQMEKTAQYLKEEGVSVTMFDQWGRYNWREFDCCHLFKADPDTLSMARFLFDNQIPFALSPVFFNIRSHQTLRFYLRCMGLLRLLLGSVYNDLTACGQVCRYARMVLPNTAAEADLISRVFDIEEAKMNLVPNGVDKRFCQANPDLFVKRFNISNFILTVSTLSYKRKNILNLIAALSTIDHPAVLIGPISDSVYGARCREAILKNKRILWIPGLSHDDPLLASAYSACSVFALPSLLETPGLAALEAGLTGANIVITPHGGTREYFRDMAEYPDPTNVASIRNALLRSLSKKRNAPLQQHILDNYTWDKVAQKTLSAYRKMVDKN